MERFFAGTGFFAAHKLAARGTQGLGFVAMDALGALAAQGFLIGLAALGAEALHDAAAWTGALRRARVRSLRRGQKRPISCR